MNKPAARRAVLDGNRAAVDIRRTLSAVSRLALFLNESIPLERSEVEDLIDILAEFLAEANDASPKV